MMQFVQSEDLAKPQADMLPGSTVFHSDDLGLVREHITKTYCPHDLQLARRGDTLNAWLKHIRLDKIGIGAMGYGADVEIEGIGDENMLLLMQPLSGAAAIGTSAETVEADVNSASVVDTANLRRMRWSNECTQRVVQIPYETLEQHAMMLMGRPLTQRLSFSQHMPLSSNVATCWHYASLLSLELTMNNNEHSRAVISNLETLFILKLLESQPSNYSEQFKPQPCKIAPQHVRRTEQYIIENAHRPITMEKLVEIGGVSARALFDGYRRFRGTSPMSFYKSVRLERARADLLAARHNETVTEIACRWGFYQFGRFAAEYKNFFGELPSETLRRVN